MIINEKYLMDIDDDDDNGIASDIIHWIIIQKNSFINYKYVENYKALDDSKYKVETERTNGTITNLKIKRIA